MLRSLTLLVCLALAASARLAADPAPPEAEDLLGLIGPRSGEVIADVGCGRGTWTFLLAQAVGSAGRVVAVDIDARVLEAVGERVTKEGWTNVHVRHSLPDDPRLEAETFDAILLNDVIDHVERDALAGFLAGLRGALKPEGRLVVRDPNGGADRVIAEGYRAGFSLVEAMLPLRGAPPRSFTGGWYALKLRRGAPQHALLPRLGQPERHRTRLFLAEELFRAGLLAREDLRAVWERIRERPGGADPAAEDALDLVRAAEALDVLAPEALAALRARLVPSPAR
jgi:SAM-dependent methyltransferase